MTAAGISNSYLNLPFIAPVCTDSAELMLRLHKVNRPFVFELEVLFESET